MKLSHSQKACIGIFIPCSILLLVSTAVAVRDRMLDSHLGVWSSLVLQICWSVMPITSCFGWIRSNWPTMWAELSRGHLKWSTLTSAKKLCLLVFVPCCTVLFFATPCEVEYIVSAVRPPAILDVLQAIAWLELSLVGSWIGIRRWKEASRFQRWVTAISIVGSIGVSISTPISCYGLHPKWSDVTLLLCWAIPPVTATLGWIRVNWPSIQYDLVKAALPAILEEEEILFWETIARGNPRMVWWLVIRSLRVKIAKIFSRRNNQN